MIRLAAFIAAALLLPAALSAVQAEPAPDGTYTLASPKLGGEGPLELVFAVTAPEWDATRSRLGDRY